LTDYKIGVLNNAIAFMPLIDKEEPRITPLLMPEYGKTRAGRHGQRSILDKAETLYQNLK
jgi:hypothetical protein